jgi:hypothetical protein
MWARNVPVKVLRFQKNRKDIGKDKVERGGNIPYGIGFQPGRGAKPSNSVRFGILNIHRLLLASRPNRMTQSEMALSVLSDRP